MTARRIAAAVTLAAVGLLTTSPVVVAACVLGGLSFLGRSATWQVLARSAAWMVVIPAVVVTAIGLPHGFLPPLRLFAAPSVAMAALAVAAPLLEDDRVRATFAPLALRRWFLAAATAAIASGGALVQLGSKLHSAHEGAALVGMGALLLASGMGVVRMRAWGVLAGALSAGVALVAAAHFERGGLGWPIFTAMIPGLMMVTGVFEARRRVRQTSTALAPAPVRVRVAEVSEPEALPESLATLAEPACARMEA